MKASQDPFDRSTREPVPPPNNSGAGWLPRSAVIRGKNANQIFPYTKIDILCEGEPRALRYERPLLDTAKVWRSRRNSCSSFVFSFFRLLLRSESSLFGPPRLRRKPAKSQS